MSPSHEVLIVGGGAAGIAVAASLQARLPGLDIAIIEPAASHVYQPGWTMVGAEFSRPAIPCTYRVSPVSERVISSEIAGPQGAIPGSGCGS